MTAVAAIKRVDPVDAFAARAEVRAWLWSIGEITLDEAVDKLQAGAVRDRLVDHIGQDAVEQIMADAFAPYQRTFARAGCHIMKDDVIPKGLRRDPGAKLWAELEGDEAHGEPADREAEQLAADAVAPGTSDDPNRAMDDFPLIRDAGERSRQKTRTNSHAAAGEVIHPDDFVAYLPRHNYVFIPTREPWPAASVNARIAPVSNGGETIAASTWLDKNRPVEQMTWAPGEPLLIKDRLVSEGGWIDRAGCTSLNLYRPPILRLGNAKLAKPWLDHVHRIYPGEGDHVVRWLAHRVQRPREKINHALVLGGAQGIGKDTLLEPVKRAVGPWNFYEISPQHLLGRFNGFAKSVILRMNEARDLGEMNRCQLCDHLKAYTATPPDVLRVDEKNLREHSVFNCCGVIITTNHKGDGIYLPADDRRHFVAWSDLTKDDFDEAYWNGIWSWYENGGDSHVAAYLAVLDLSSFNSKAPPPKTSAFWDIVTASRSSEDSELADALDLLGNPDAVTLLKVQNIAPAEFAVWLKDRKNRRAIPHRFEQCGYVPVRNDAAKDGDWKIGGTRQRI